MIGDGTGGQYTTDADGRSVPDCVECGLEIDGHTVMGAKCGGCDEWVCSDCRGVHEGGSCGTD